MAEEPPTDFAEHDKMTQGTRIDSHRHRNKIVFLGGGRITAALLSGLRLANCRLPIVVHDRNAHKLRALTKEFGVAIEPDLLCAVEQAYLLVLAVRPANVAGALEEIRRGLPQSKVLKKRKDVLACSLAAGIPLALLRELSGPQFRWARAMPSPLARTRNGLTAVAFDRRFPRAGRDLVRRFFEHVSSIVEVPEAQFDIFTATYSPSHGYHAVNTLAAAAQELGLDRRTAFVAAAHALADAIRSWRKGDESLDALRHEAATPGGIAATVMKSMDDSGYARIARRALRAGVQRARANARLP
jgi:pyrroline-5-carboxylate reductase